MTGKEHVACVK